MDDVIKSIEVINNYMSYNDIDGIDEKKHMRIMSLLDDLSFQLNLTKEMKKCHLDVDKN